MSTMTQAYRITCIPKENRLDSLIIPPEYVGQEIEIIILPLVEDNDVEECPLCAKYNHEEHNAETLAAMREAEDIASGKIQAKSYSSHKELVAEIEAEIAAEGNN